MADITSGLLDRKASDLVEASELDGEEFWAGVQGGADIRIKTSQLTSHIAEVVKSDPDIGAEGARPYAEAAAASAGAADASRIASQQNVGQATVERQSAELARTQAQAAAAAAVAAGPIYASVEAGRAAVAVDAQFRYLSADGLSVYVATKNGADASTIVTDIPSAAFVRGVQADRAKGDNLLSVALAPVTERTFEAADLPAVRIGARTMQPDRAYFDLRYRTGIWEDSNLPWHADGRYDNIWLQTETADLDVESWYFDLRPRFATYKATGAIYLPIAAATPMPQMEAEIVSPTLIYLYVRQFDATYVRWALDHAVNTAMRCNVWRIGACHHVVRSASGYSVVQEICFDGENDVAILFRRTDDTKKNKPDHIGGKAHGNEVQTFSRLLLNTEVLDPTTATGRFEVSYIELIQTSDMFDPGNDPDIPVYNGAHIMSHTKRVRLTSDGWWEQWSHIDHVVEGFKVANAYFGMICLGWGTRGYDAVHTAARSPLYALEDVSASFVDIYTASDRFKAWGDAYSAEWEALDGWTFDPPGETDRGRNISINSRTDRRKIYPDWFEGQVTSTAVPWGPHCRYRVTIKKDN